MRYIGEIVSGSDVVLECYHVSETGGRNTLSLAVTRLTDLSLSNYAKALRDAADWFDAVAVGKVAQRKCDIYCQVRHIHVR